MQLKLNALLRKDTDSINSELEYKGLVLNVRYMSRSALLAMSRNCMVMRYDDKKKVREQQLDGDRFTKEFAKATISGWKNATPLLLADIIPLDLSALTQEQKEAELPFELDSVLTLLKTAYDMDAFVQDFVTDIKNFKPHLEEEAKNSEPSPSGS